MKMQKSPPELVETFDRAFPEDARAQRRQMFGSPAGFVNGNHFGGLFADHVVLRLAEADRRALAEQYGAVPFAPMGRPMSDPIVNDAALLREWLIRALEHAAAMPAKQPKTAKKAR
jgi:TfoX/Sxy family transcriptional regulator of competence genes